MDEVKANLLISQEDPDRANAAISCSLADSPAAF